MRSAFGVAVGHLAAKLGGTPGGWTWARLHTRYFPSVSGAAGLGYGPRASSGDAWTVDAAEGGLQSSIGPSWRMIVNFSVPAGHPVTAEGVYPGGQSENPASPWYANLIADWWDNRYLPMASPGNAGAGAVRWSLRPAAAGTVAAGAGLDAGAHTGGAGRAGARG
jgi:penicillin amidase